MEDPGLGAVSSKASLLAHYTDRSWTGQHLSQVSGTLTQCPCLSHCTSHLFRRRKVYVKNYYDWSEVVLFQQQTLTLPGLCVLGASGRKNKSNSQLPSLFPACCSGGGERSAGGLAASAPLLGTRVTLGACRRRKRSLSAALQRTRLPWPVPSSCDPAAIQLPQPQRLGKHISSNCPRSCGSSQPCETG